MIDWKIIFPLLIMFIFIYNRTYLAYIIIGIIIVLDYFKINRINKNNDYNKALKLLRSYITTFIKISGINMEMNNLNLVPNDDDNPLLIVSNHMSNLDIMNIILHLDKEFLIVAKKELLKLPIISKLLVTINTLFLDRDNLRESIKVFSNATKLFTKDKALVIYPQGTRRDDFENFKAGSYAPISKTGGKIMIIRNNDLNKALEKRKPFLININVTSEIIDVISVQKGTTTKEINDQVLNKF